MARKAEFQRKTAETDIQVEMNLDGTEMQERISTSIPFLDHMLTLFSRHGFFDFSITGRGDISVDYHHLVEDIGICMGEVFKKAVGDKTGINRYGSAVVPMDESLCSVVLDISGRPYLVYHVEFDQKKIGEFDPSLLLEFFKAFSDHAEMTLHINLMYGTNNHHKAEAIFKAFARALCQAVSTNPKVKGVLSTKGKL
jgi:imidazoleglycerol-phosphate dehydratase